MIEFREMKIEEAAELMDFFQEQNVKQPLLIHENDLVFLSIENRKINGFLILKQPETGIIELNEIVVAGDHWDIKDGLIRAMMHAMCHRSVHWILIKKDACGQSLPLRDKFSEAVSEPELSDFFESNECTYDMHAYYCVRPSTVYTGGCRGTT
jgi:hypothetical protein